MGETYQRNFKIPQASAVNLRIRGSTSTDAAKFFFGVVGSGAHVGFGAHVGHAGHVGVVAVVAVVAHVVVGHAGASPQNRPS